MADARLQNEKERKHIVGRIEGHLVADVDGRAKCLLCGTVLLTAIQFNLRECRGES